MFLENGFYIAIGSQGEGKTAMITYLMLVNSNFGNDRKIYSNYTLSVPHNKITLDSIIKQLDNDPSFYNNSIILMDEIHLYLDSRDFMSKNNRKIQTFFSQLRKRNILLLGTSQYIMHVDVRVRRHAKMVFDMRNLSNGMFGCTISKIDGYYTNAINDITLNLSVAYDFYDTYEVIID